MYDDSMLPLESPIKPTLEGFHCDGDCWGRLGRSGALVRTLETVSPELRDWFAYGDWATEAALTDHRLPPLQELHPTQDFLVESTVESYAAKHFLTQPDGAKFYEAYPTLFRWESHLFIFQGTHRLAALHRRNATHFRGWIIDLDEVMMAQGRLG